MEEKLLREASNWTLQQDEEVRLLLENFQNGVSNTGARLNLNIEQLKVKVLSTDCGIQQLNTQLALLKNAKFVENTVEEEDSRPIPIPPTVAFSKEEMVRIVVDSVKNTLKNVTTRLHWDRDPLGIECLPSFNDEAFNTYSLGPSRPPPQIVHQTRMEADAVSLQEQRLDAPTIPKMVPPAATIPIAVQNGFGDCSSEESEPEVKISSVQKIPEPPSMDGFKPPAPVIANLPKPQARGLFSSDDEEEEADSAVIASVQSVAPVVKSNHDLMQQLASKLKNRETRVTEKAKNIVTEIAVPKKAPAVIKEETVVVQKEEPKPVAVQRCAVVAATPEATSSTKVTSSITVTKHVRKEEPPLQQKRLEEPVAPKTTVTRKEPMKKRGLFSDSDSSDEEFMAPVKPVVVKPVHETRKVEISKPVIKKTTPTVRKSIFDSDSSDDEFTGFFKKSATVEKKATASSSILQRRPVSPVKTLSQPEPVKKIAPAEKSISNSSSLHKHEIYLPVLAAKSENQPSSIDPLAAEKDFSAPSSQSRSNTSVPVSQTPVTVQTEPTQPVSKQKEVLPKSVSPVDNTPTTVPIEPARTNPLFESRPPSVDFSPVPDTRSESPPEEVPDYLEQDNLPPLPTTDPLTDSPLEEEMPVGKPPGKLNNSNFAAMLGRQLSAGPPGSRPKSVTSLSTDSEPVSSSTPASVSVTPTSDSPGGLCHLTKSRPRRPHVHKPALNKTEEEKKSVTDPLEALLNGLSELKLPPPSIASKQAPIPKSPEKVRSVTKTPIVEKKAEPAKPLNGSSNVATSTPEEKTPLKVSTSIKRATTTSTSASKKGLFDFSSSDDEPSNTSKITRAAATLKTSVTSGSPSLTLKPKSTPTPLSGTAASKSMPRNANLAKYKNMFDQEDDLDVSLFKKDKA